MKNRSSLGLLALALLAALSTAPSYARGPGSCPASPRPLPTSEQRQYLMPERLLRCFLSAKEVATIRSARYHDAQTTVTDPQYESGELNPDGSPRPPLTADQTAALARMHSILDQDMRAGAVLRKYVQNSDVGGYLYGRTVIGSPGSEVVVMTNTVRGFVGLERNTQGLDAGETVAALGLDYETAAVGQFTDASPMPLHRQLALEVLRHGLHSIRHRMSAQGAIDAKIPLARDLNDSVEASTPSLDGRSFEMDRSGQDNPYTGLGISDNIGLLTEDPDDPPDTTYPLHLNEEDVMTTPTPLAGGDEILRRAPDGTETLIARYLRYIEPDGSHEFRWALSPRLSAADKAYYRELIQQAAASVEAAGG
ncbi:MAG: hypothetical protein ACJ76Y_15140 [Thermoanaerobaculia bacterium]